MAGPAVDTSALSIPLAIVLNNMLVYRKGMDPMRRWAKCLVLIGCVGALVFPASVWADSITIEAHPATFPESLAGPSHVDLAFHVERGATAFAGSQSKPVQPLHVPLD